MTVSDGCAGGFSKWAIGHDLKDATASRSMLIRQLQNIHHYGPKPIILLTERGEFVEKAKNVYVRIQCTVTAGV